MFPNRIRKGKTQYQLKWQGHGEDYSWELEENLNCPDLIKEYEDQFVFKEDTDDEEMDAGESSQAEEEEEKTSERVPRKKHSLSSADSSQSKDVYFSMEQMKIIEDASVRDINLLEAFKVTELVKFQLLKICFKNFTEEHAALMRQKADQLLNGRGTKTTDKKIQKINLKIKSLSEQKEEHNDLFFLQSIHKTENIDWESIAEQMPQHSADELCRWWQQNRPDVKTEPFSAEERKVLKILLIDSEKEINWTDISEKLATETNSKLKRTAENVEDYYHQYLDKSRRVFGWSPEDDEKLKQLVGGKDSSTIDWAGIASLFPGRSKVQV